MTLVECPAVQSELTVEQIGMHRSARRTHIKLTKVPIKSAPYVLSIGEGAARGVEGGGVASDIGKVVLNPCISQAKDTSILYRAAAS